MAHSTTPIGTAMSSKDGTFTLTKTEKITSTYEQSESIIVSRKSSGVHLRVGPTPSGVITWMGGSILLSIGQAELLAKELLRVAAAEPPAE